MCSISLFEQLASAVISHISKLQSRMYKLSVRHAFDHAALYYAEHEHLENMYFKYKAT